MRTVGVIKTQKRGKEVKNIFAVGVLMVLLVPAILIGVGSASNNISGYIKDTDSAPIQNAYVSDNQSTDSNHTNTVGYYFLTGFVNGNYEIEANKTDFYHSNSTVVTIAGADLTNQNITLTTTIEKLIYEQNQLLTEENEMIAQTWLFLVLLLISFVFLAAGYLSPNATLKIFGAAFSSVLFIILAYAIIGNQFGEKLQMAWLATLLGALGIIQAIYTLLLVISLLYMMFTTRRQAGVDSIPFDPGDRNW